MKKDYKLSGYTTTRNSVEMDYPFRETIKSLLDFCDEVVVADSSDKDDGTMEALEELQEEHDNLEVVHVDVDWSEPNHGVWDGQMKAIAREQCTGDYLWQQDADECVDPNIRPKIDEIIKRTNGLSDMPLIALPVVEYWGGLDKVRIDVQPWKWRLSKNDPNITHGIPASHRVMKNGLLYSKPGSDGCDYIFEDSGEVVPCMHFVNQNINNHRMAAVTDPSKVKEYEEWFNLAVQQLPTVYHFSWFDIVEKIRKFKLYWNNHWKSLYGFDLDNKNPFFNKPWEQVSDEEIKSYVKNLVANTGGWIFHNPWDGTKTNHVVINEKPPIVMKDWCITHSEKELTEEDFKD